MIQAARLSLRMQKELKLLLTDPPPGASFPLLTSDFDVSSLSSIEAQIEGPEGTVYAKGIFNIKIQIPERYPFQPPIVTFATPIYHPNIDNGGRICLDILNLPPKGAWQPSLNISTVLTSIGLLLSEPNPDDGLMCEASKEYKYNRQAFNQKARSMTEKYAKAGAGGNSSTGSSQSQCIQINSDTSEIQGLHNDANFEVNGFFSSHKKPSGVRQKLSLESPSIKQKREPDGQARDVPTDQHFFPDFENEAEVNQKGKEVEGMHYVCNLGHEKPQGMKRKLSLACSGQVQKRDVNMMENVLNESPPCEPQSIPMAYSGLSMLHESICHGNQVNQSLENEPVTAGTNSNMFLCESKQKEPVESIDRFKTNSRNNQERFYGGSLSKNQNELLSRKDNTNRMGGSTPTKFREQGLVHKRLSLGCKGALQEEAEDEKENVKPVNELPFPNPQTASTKVAISRELSLVPLSQLRGSNDIDHCYDGQLVFHSQSHVTITAEPLLVSRQSRGDEKQQVSQDVKEESMISEAVVVLDSEDSEEEGNGCCSSKLSLARRRIGKRKAIA